MSDIYEPYPDNEARWHGDNGFSRGFAMANHSFSFDWFDSHIHLAHSHFPNRLNGDQIQHVMAHYFALTGKYHSARAILIDPYMETMKWAKNKSNVHLFWWMKWQDGDKLDEVKRLVDEGLIQGIKLHSGSFRDASAREKGIDYRIMGTKEWHGIYDYCEEVDLPFIIHLNQHLEPNRYSYGAPSREFWASVDYTNHDMLEFFLSEMASGHPEMKWTLAHMNFMGNDSLGKVFDEYSNVYADTSIGFVLREYGYLTTDEVRHYRDFAIRHADRLMFGTDAFAYHPLERDYPDHIYNWWLPHYIFINAIRLPQDVLEKITYGTCEKFIGRYLKTEPRAVGVVK